MNFSLVLETYSRRVVGGSIDTSPAAVQGTNALGVVIDNRLQMNVEVATILHSDQGVKFQCWAFTKRARDSGLLASMGSIGDCCDNLIIKSFW